MNDVKTIVAAIKEKNKAKLERKNLIVKKYKDLNKVKKLTQEQRISRIEELLGLI